MFYKVSRPHDVPDAHDYGYESPHDFAKAIRRIVLTHEGDVGECRSERNGLLLLRFHDPLTGQYTDEWIPDFCCTSAPPPVVTEEADDDPLAGILGMGW